MSPDQSQGEDPEPVSLDELYDLVPQAEEVDLREELERETARRYWVDRLRPLIDAADPETTPPGDDGDDGNDGGDGDSGDAGDEPWRLSEGQVVGMLEHLLGAEQVDDRPDPT